MGLGKRGEWLVGIDVGTSLIKTTLFDLDGSEAGSSSEVTKLTYPRPSWVECDMNEVFAAVVKSLRTVVGMSQAASREVLAIGITAQGDGTWLVDAADMPVRRAITWMDGRAAEYLRVFRESGVSAQIFRATGTALSTSNQAVQLRWLKDHEPESLARAKAAFCAKDWIFLKLTGRLSTDLTDASHTYFNGTSNAYDSAILEALGIGTCAKLLPPALPCQENKGALLPAAARLIGLPAGTPVTSGPFDIIATDLGAGIIRPGDACSILGTAGIHQIVTNDPVPSPQGEGSMLLHAPSKTWIRCMMTMSGTSNTEWFVRDLYLGNNRSTPEQQQADPWAAVEDSVRSIPFGSDGVMYLPFINPAGERAPFVAPSARAQFTGLSFRHGKAVMARAVYEGVVLAALDCFSRLPTQIGVLTLAGGGCRSSVWPQMFADALGCPVRVVQGQETGAKGAVLNAGVALGIYSDFVDSCSRTVRLSREIPPHKDMAVRYLTLLDRYRKTCSAMLPVWEELGSAFPSQEGPASIV